MDNFILKNQVILKIDTEGYEYKILKGLNKKHLERIDFIYIEHHYDQMIMKDYKFSNINDFLKNNNFNLSFKIRMNFRKTFEYIYEKKNTNKLICNYFIIFLNLLIFIDEFFGNFFFQ